jgi:glucose/arabinose dehydrogenase
MMRMFRALIVGFVLTLLGPASASALSLQPIDDFDSPVYVTSDPSDPDRLFVVEQDGRVQLTEEGTTKTFLDIESIVRSPADAPGPERGLLSMAFHPDYASNGLFYVFFTASDDPGTADDETGDLHIAEFEAGGDDAHESSRRDVLTIEHSGHPGHNGGQLQFGPDGYLYASIGDGGGGGDQGDDAQELSLLLGKILRIDPAGDDPGDFSVPADNPFAGVTGCADGCDEIWSYGLRNPWRFSFDRLTGALVVADVGQHSWEELNYEPASAGGGEGDNFGWDCREGMHDYTGPPESPAPECPDRVGTFTDPVFEYPHTGDPDDFTGCSIIGGYVARDPALGDLYGRYVYADLCAGGIRSLSPAVPTASNDRSAGVPVASPRSFGEDAAGRIYVAEGDGMVSRLKGPPPTSSPPPSPPSSPPQAPLDTIPANLKLDAKPRQDVDGSLKVRALVDEAAEVALRAKLRLGGGKALGLGEETSPLAARVEEKLKWKLSRRERRRARHRLRDGEKVKARVKGEATDASGNTSERDSLKIKLAR